MLAGVLCAVTVRMLSQRTKRNFILSNKTYNFSTSSQDMSSASTC